MEERNLENMLFNAIKLNDLQFIICLLKKDIDFNIRDKNRPTPLHLAAQEGRYEIVKLLLEKSANLNIQNKEGDTPFYYAIKTFERIDARIYDWEFYYSFKQISFLKIITFLEVVIQRR